MHEDLKAQILQTALELFNKNGYEAVSMRDIAGALHISPGNLTYHFKKKHDIIDALIAMAIQDHQNRHYSQDISLEDFNQVLKANIEHQKKYSFYFNNIVELPRKYPEIAQMQTRGKVEIHNLIRGILQNFVRKGIMKPEPYKGVYDDLAFGIFSIVMFWAQQNSLEDDILSHQKSLLSVVWSILLPTLTNEGLRMVPHHDD